MLSEHCKRCKQNIVILSQFQTDPHLFIVGLDKSKIQINKSLLLDVDGKLEKFKLKEIVYFGEFHFTCLLFDAKFNCMYHNSIATGFKLYEVEHISDFKDLIKYDNRDV